MVKYIFFLFAVFSFYSIGYAETAELHVSSNCAYCVPAKVIINKLIAEGYDVKIITNSKERMFPVLIIKTGGKVIRYVGLKTEAFYRRIIPKNVEANKPLVMDRALKPNNAVLFVVDDSPNSRYAEVIIRRLSREGYTVAIWDNSISFDRKKYFDYPVLILYYGDKPMFIHIGLLSEKKYRELIPQK